MQGHRLAVRLVMILLAHGGWAASAIAELWGRPATVRRWIQCFHTPCTTELCDRPARDGP